MQKRTGHSTSTPTMNTLLQDRANSLLTSIKHPRAKDDMESHLVDIQLWHHMDFSFHEDEIVAFNTTLLSEHSYLSEAQKQLYIKVLETYPIAFSSQFYARPLLEKELSSLRRELTCLEEYYNRKTPSNLLTQPAAKKAAVAKEIAQSLTAVNGNQVPKIFRSTLENFGINAATFFSNSTKKYLTKNSRDILRKGIKG